MKLDNIEKIIIPKIEEEGFEIEYVEFVKEGDNNILRVVIDNPNGNVAIDDCEKIRENIIKIKCYNSTVIIKRTSYYNT